MSVMANRHFGKLSDVWKHAALAEVLERERPRRYAETHAGSGAYPIVHDGERPFGILRFLDVAAGCEVLARSSYRAIAASWLSGRGLYPGSALLAMTVLGDASSYLLCDLDRGSAADLRRWAGELSLRGCEVVQADGMAAAAAWLDRDAGKPGLVHIDPFDPDARGPGGYSALELAARVADSGTSLVYWYGYDRPGEQAWAYPRLTAQTGAPLWCGDVMVTGTSSKAGDLGRATTPGTGFGVIVANVQAGTADACTAVGNALAEAYAGALLPDGSRGNLIFTTRTSGRTA
jgi:Ribosomal RNA large subunit methyltransferase D, RlmJ